MKLKQELGMLAAAIDNGFTPTAHGDFIYLYGELFSSQIFKHKVSYDFLDLLERDEDKYYEKDLITKGILKSFDDFKFGEASDIKKLTLEEFSTFDATSYHAGVKGTIWELPTNTLQKYTALVTKELGFCEIYADVIKGTLYFTNDKMEIGIITSLRKKPERLF